MVTDMIMLERIPRRQAVKLNMQWYDPVELFKWIQSGQRVVPHSRRRMTGQELAIIRTRGKPPQRAVRPPPTGTQAYFRRETRGWRADYKYFAAVDSERAYQLTPAGNWTRLPVGRIDSRILMERIPSRVDVSPDFAAGGQGHWQRVRNGTVDTFTAPHWSTGRHHATTAFFVALRNTMHPMHAALWRGYA